MFRKILFGLLIIIAAPKHLNGQTPVYPRKEIVKLTDKADAFLLDLKFKESLFYSREALKQAITINDSYLIATAYNTIAGNYDELSEVDKAVHNYKKALYYANKTDNDSLKGWVNNNLGNIYLFEKKDYSTGVFYYQRALEYAGKVKDTSNLYLTNLNLSWGNFDIGNYENAAQHFQFLTDNHERYSSPETEVIYNMLKGMVNAHNKNYQEAEKYFKTAISTAHEVGEPLDLAYSSREYAKLLLELGDYKNAYKYMNDYHTLVNEVYDQSKLKKADVEGVHLELDEYKRALERIEAEKEIQGLSLRRSQIITILSIVGACVLLILLYTLYVNNNFKKKINRELRQTNEELKRARDKAEEASRLKTQFVSTISHELRTPLYGVVGITNMILDEHKELAESTHLNSLKFSAKYLLALVNDILQINKIEENRLALEMLTFNLADEIITIKDSLQFIAIRNNNKLTAHIDPEIPEYIIGDKLRLSQIFMNLVSNALKFTKNGEVMIMARLERVEGKFHHIKFMVKDNGIGIAKDDQEKVFDKFVQIERKNDDYQGTGLGLSIVKRLVTLFNSEIHLESKENDGTTFTFTIAFEVDEEKTREIINDIEVDLSAGHVFSILVVEDNKINQIVTKKILESNNFTCRMVDDGYAAIELTRTADFDVILMDINMPGLNGFETTRKIRDNGIHTPIIALTAFGKEEVAEEAMSSGMNEIIVKPFEPHQLFRVINQHISKEKDAD
ncbi:MAG: response regulator [Flavobacterium sp.]|nr:response regulator [Flavobacterium sp.]